jgi:hypothetical protein
MSIKTYRVWVKAIPKEGQTFFFGYIDIDAPDEESIPTLTVMKLFSIYNHRDWTLIKYKRLKDAYPR